MKKNTLLLAAAIFAFGMTACTDEELDIINTGDIADITDVASAPRVKTTADLHNTDWTATISLTDIISAMTDGYDLGCIDSIDYAAFESYLSFDGTFAHFTFSSNIEAWAVDDNDMMQQITGVDFNYSYDGLTHTGTLDGEDGEGNPASIAFTYNDSTDAITILMPLYVDGDTNATNYTVVYNRAE